MSHLFRRYILEKKEEKSWKKWFDNLWDGTKIYIVDGKYVRDNMNIEFELGGHGYVYDFIPKDEIWVERMIHDEDDAMDALHEIVEYILMKYVKDYDGDYDKAHAAAANIEKNCRGIFHLQGREKE